MLLLDFSLLLIALLFAFYLLALAFACICGAIVCWSASLLMDFGWIYSASVCWSASFALILDRFVEPVCAGVLVCCWILVWICSASVCLSASLLLDFGVDLWRQCVLEC